jgi:hypothetical protein
VSEAELREFGTRAAEGDRNVGALAPGTTANPTRLAREMLFAFPSRSAPLLSNGHFNSPQSDHPVMKHVIVEIIPSGAES